jgi:uncharacterized Zn finger protein
LLDSEHEKDLLFKRRDREGMHAMSWYGRRGGSYRGGGRDYWPAYVSVATRRNQAAQLIAEHASESDRELAPVTLAGQKIATSFWGQAWCKNLECYSDFSNRLPRGRSYVRNGSVADLSIERGKVRALVCGSDMYQVTISIKTLAPAAWKLIKHDCSQSIDTLLDLLAGRFDKSVMERLTRAGDGLFPKSNEISIKCSCPDWAGLCKHSAATLYGVGARLDSAPELLFTLRDVDHLELIGQAAVAENLDRTLDSAEQGALAGSDLGEIFGIELDLGESKAKKTRKPKEKKPAARKKSAGRKQPSKKGALPSSQQKTKKPTKTTRKKPARAKK